MTVTVNRSFPWLVGAIILGTVQGVLAAAGQPGGPLQGAFWIAPVVGGLGLLAALVKEQASDATDGDVP